MRKVVFATAILATICFTISAFGADIDSKKLAVNADYALRNNKAAECVAWMQALESAKRIELMELEKQKLQLEIRFYQRSENLWKCLPYFIKYGKGLLDTLDKEQRKEWSESSIIVKGIDIFLKAADTGAVQQKDFTEIGTLLKKADAEMEKRFKEFK